MIPEEDAKKRLHAAYLLLAKDSTTLEQFESARTLIKGLSPRIDKLLTHVSRTHSDVVKLEQGDFVSLTAEHLPEGTEEEKERKRRLLLLIRYWKELRGEVERVRSEFEREKVQQGNSSSFGKILAGAKGPFGLVTIAAVVIVAGYFILSQNQAAPIAPVTVASKTKVIIFQDKKIPLTEIEERTGPDCMENQASVPHYHAKDHTQAKALDGSMVGDPGSCGFGKVDEVEIVEVE